jgi:hypothetical protein
VATPPVEIDLEVAPMATPPVVDAAILEVAATDDAHVATPPVGIDAAILEVASIVTILEIAPIAAILDDVELDRPGRSELALCKVS